MSPNDGKRGQDIVNAFAAQVGDDELLQISKEYSFEEQITKIMSKKTTNNFHKNRFDMNILYSARRALAAK